MENFTNGHDRSEEMLRGMKTPFDKNTAGSWDAIQKKIESEKNQIIPIEKPKTKRSYWLAASIIGLIAFSSILLVSQNKNKHYTLSTEKHLELPDGSDVHIFKNSSLSYNEYDGKRSVYLKGGAIFSVKKGGSFLIHTEQGSVEVLGTTFLVESRNEHFSVKCSEGSVKVDLDNEKIELSAGEAVRSSNNKLIPYSIKKEEITDRINGIINFDQAPLSEVFMQIENEFDVKISYAFDLNAKLYSGNFKEQDLSETLDLIATPMGLKYRINGKMIEFLE